MPRVSAEYMQQRRDELTAAALRCFQAKGFSNTSIADVVEESGASAGAIYTHFANKAELAMAVAERVLGGAITARLGATMTPAMRPLDVVRAFLGAFRDEDAPTAVILQVWGAATTDPELLTGVLGGVDRLRTVVREPLKSWLRERAPSDDAATLDAATLDAQTDRLIAGMVSIVQGYIVTTSLLGPVQIDEFLDAQAAALA